MPDLGLFQHFVRDVGRHDLDAKAVDLAPISFSAIASEYGSCPVEAAAHQMRMRLWRARVASSEGMMKVLEMLERNLVAEEKGLVGGHGFDHVGDQRFGFGANRSLLRQLGRSAKPGRRASGSQPALDQILLLRRQQQSGALFQQLAEKSKSCGVTADLP